jgi:hypothetical protein
VGEYAWEKCGTVDQAIEVHRQLMVDHNRLPHFAHRRRADNKYSPLEVLGPARGRDVEAATLHRAFSRMSWNRKTDARGFVRLNRWRIYVEAGLPKTPVQVTYWDGKLRTEYKSYILAECRCRWDNTGQRPHSISQLHYYPTPFHSRQMALFDPLWVRHPIEGEPLREASEAASSSRQATPLVLWA